MSAFPGFGPDCLPFFRALAFHQTREWMEENKGIYEREVKQPMALLLDDLTARFAAQDVPLKGDARRSTFRLARDVRFSKDKSLYKTQAGAVMTRTGTKNEQGLLYIHIAPDGCFVAAGFYHPEPVQLAELRRDIVARAGVFRALDLRFDGEDASTRNPRGYETVGDPVLAQALRQRSLVQRESLADLLIHTPALADVIAGFARKNLPFLDFGWNAIDRLPPAPKRNPRARLRTRD